VCTPDQVEEQELLLRSDSRSSLAGWLLLRCACCDPVLQVTEEYSAQGRGGGDGGGWGGGRDSHWSSRCAQVVCISDINSRCSGSGAVWTTATNPR
jgi:hypothetical protein